MPVNSRKKHLRGHREFASCCRKAGYAASIARGLVDDGSFPGLHLEIRRTERFYPDAALQAAELAARGRMPVVAHRRSHQPWLITLALPDFLRLYGAYLQRPLPDPESPAAAAYPGSDPDSAHRPADTPAPSAF